MQPTQVRETKFRRVVTGHAADGQAVIASDTRIEQQVWPRGAVVHKLWGADTPPTYPDAGMLTIAEDFSWFPPYGLSFCPFPNPAA